MPGKRTPAERSKAKICSEISSQRNHILQKTLEASRSGGRESNRDRPSDTVFIRRRTVMEIHGVAPLLEVFDMPTSLRFLPGCAGFHRVGLLRAGGPLRWVRAEVASRRGHAEHRLRGPVPSPSARFGSGGRTRGYLPVFSLQRPRCCLQASACTGSQLEGTLGCALPDEATLVPGSGWIRAVLSMADNEGRSRSLGEGLRAGIQGSRVNWLRPASGGARANELSAV